MAPAESVAWVESVQRDRVGPTLIVQRAAKLGHIGPNEIRRQAHGVGRGDNRLVAERPTQDVQGVRQEMPRRSLVAVRPKKAHEAVARDGCAGSPRDDRE